jgi:hypothetical protein
MHLRGLGTHNHTVGPEVMAAEEHSRGLSIPPVAKQALADLMYRNPTTQQLRPRPWTTAPRAFSCPLSRRLLAAPQQSGVSAVYIHV